MNNVQLKYHVEYVYSIIDECCTCSHQETELDLDLTRIDSSTNQSSLLKSR
jgi:hypothetical protein